MLDKVFMCVLDMSISGTVVIAIILLARLALKKSPRVISYALWSVVLLRLLCPISMEAPVSVMPEIPPVEDTYELADAPISFAGAGIAAYQAVGDVLNGGIDKQHIPTTNTDALGNIEYVTADWTDVWILFGQYVWLVGMISMVGCSIISYLKLHRRLAVKVNLRDNIYIADDIESPFVIGFMKTKIFLPTALGEREQGYIIAHEQYHIRRLDHITKALAFLTLTIHWFNPAVWLAFVLASRDMEMSCDEAVIRKFGAEARADYAASLLALATGKRIIAGTPLAFGEGDPKSRIRNLAKWKKPVIWITAVATVLCTVLAVCLLTDPVEDAVPNETVPTQPTSNETIAPAETTMPHSTEPEWIIDFATGVPESMYPFVYDKNDETLLAYLGNYSHIVNTNALRPGALYVLDIEKNELRLLIESGVSIVRGTPNAIFCVVDNTKLICTDYFGSRMEMVYKTANSRISSAERTAEWMCLIEGDYIICLNLTTYQIEDSYRRETAGSAFLLNNGKTLYWRTRDYAYYYRIDRELDRQERMNDIESAKLIMGKKAPESFFRPADSTDPIIYTEPAIPADLELFDGIPGVVSYNKKLENIDVTHYTPQQAAMDGCVVMVDRDVWANEDIWTAFLPMLYRRENALVRVAEYTAEGKMIRIFEFQFHQSVYIYRVLENGTVAQHAFERFYSGWQSDCAGDNYNMFIVYALTNDPYWKLKEGASYDDIIWGDASVMVFCNLYMRYEHPPIPDVLRRVEVKQDGITLAVISDGDKLDEIQQLFNAAEGYNDQPKTIVWGPELIFTGTDSTTVNARMMANSTMIEIDGVFYNYDPGWKEKYHVEDLLNLLGIA